MSTPKNLSAYPRSMFEMAATFQQHHSASKLFRSKRAAQAYRLLLYGFRRAIKADTLPRAISDYPDFLIARARIIGRRLVLVHPDNC